MAAIWVIAIRKSCVLIKMKGPFIVKGPSFLLEKPHFGVDIGFFEEDSVFDLKNKKSVLE